MYDVCVDGGLVYVCVYDVCVFCGDGGVMSVFDVGVCVYVMWEWWSGVCVCVYDVCVVGRWSGVCVCVHDVCVCIVGMVVWCMSVCMT